MRPLYVTVLNSMQVAIGFVTICTASVMLLWVVPAIRREVDRKAGRSLARVRVVASFGNAFFRAGGGFYRFELYEKCMVVCLFRAITFGYEKITIDRTVKMIRGRLVISIAGVRVSIIGDERKIEEFGRILSDRIASAKKR